jgi:hypothetical protein
MRNVFNLKDGNKLKRKQNHPRNDIYMTFAGIIRLMVEVESSGNVDDESRLLIQAAFLVRLLDKNLEEMGFEQDSVLLAYYLDATTIHRFLIYENRDVNQVGSLLACR